MGERSWKLIAPDESAVLAKSFFDAVMVEDCEGDGCFPNPACPNESDGLEFFGYSDEFLNQFLASETVPRCRGR